MKPIPQNLFFWGSTVGICSGHPQPPKLGDDLGQAYLQARMVKESEEDDGLMG